jgi:ParB-like chromosome segregation protein Spo0J
MCAIANQAFALLVRVFLLWVVYNWRMEKQLSGKAMKKFPDYKTVLVSSLIPYARNSRTHSDAQVGQIAASIKEFGFLNPIIVDGESGIIAGHGRVLAAQKLGLADLPVIEAGHLSDAQRRAYIIADNKLAMNASWDDEMLRVELDALGVDGFDLELTGFSLDEIQALSFDDEAETEMPELADGDKEPYQQKTFTLHEEQAAIVDDAITLARTNPLSDTGVNENSNGNALALICAQWLERN